MGFKWTPEFQESTVWPNPGETRRMAASARARGVTATITPTGAVVTDPRDARPHCVTGFSCDCGLFAQAGGCQHFSLLVDELGWIPEAVVAVEMEIVR